MGDERPVTINTGDAKPAPAPERPAEPVTVTIPDRPAQPAPKPADPRVVVETQRG